MPDHIHLLTAPLERELSVAAFLKWMNVGLTSFMFCRSNAAGSRVDSIVFFARRINSPEMELHSRKSRTCGSS
jgi:hypothetical protein